MPQLTGFPLSLYQIFIFENNIYYCAHVGKQAIRVVSTGKEGVIYNGLSDWLYEGEKQVLLLCRFGPVLNGRPSLG